jgi:uncharacterized protein (TIGR03435 family)
MFFRAFLACTLLLSAAKATSQVFDVATIKPVDPGGRITMVGVNRTPTGIDANFMTLGMLMQNAYGSRRFASEQQLIGLPEWAKTQRYNVKARVSETEAATLQALTPEERDHRISIMFQALLAERFGLKVHFASKPGNIYALVAAKSHTTLTPVTPTGEPGPDDNPLEKGSFTLVARGGKLIVHEYSMTQLASFLTQQAHELDRPVIDMSGLPGVYTFTMNWTPGPFFFIAGNGPAPPPPPGTPETPSIFTALQEVGLKLQPTTAPIETIVVDHVERPTAN